MESEYTPLIVLGVLVLSVMFGRLLRHLLPEHHLNPESREAVKVSVGMVATMSALMLGLLVSSAKGAYDTTRSEVTQIGAKIATLDRELALFGPGAKDARRHLRLAVDDAMNSMWSAEGPVSAVTHSQTGDSMYMEIQKLDPKDDAQRLLKSNCLAIAANLTECRALLVAQAAPSISNTMLVVVVIWLAVIFLSFSVLSPSNGTVMVASLISVLSVSGAVLLILELDRPFSGLLQISRQPMVHALEAARFGGL